MNILHGINELIERFNLTSKLVTPTERQEKKIEKIAQQLTSYPIRHQTFTGHKIAQFTMTATNDSARLESFTSALKQGDWLTAKSYENYDATQNILCAIVIQCPTGGALLLFTIDPFELYLDEYLISYEIVLLEKIESLLKIIAPDKWSIME